MAILRRKEGPLDTGSHPGFAERVLETLRRDLRADGIEVFQVNMGRRCNLRCRHCHVEAGPDRDEVMGRSVLEKCMDILAPPGIPVVDVTGGAPEMNPHLEWFIREAAQPGRRLMVRSNLAILLLEEYSAFIDVYADNQVEVVASLPDCRGSGTDSQRGGGVFREIIRAMRLLNERGYGAAGSGLVLNLVHNPAGAYLPGSQSDLESDYRAVLERDHGVIFNSLYTMTNAPIGRYLEYLISSGNYDGYIRDLCGAYNPAAVERVMCKTTISVGWDGALYDCDFNQMLGLGLDGGAPRSVFDFDRGLLESRRIVVGNHCYCCVAGAGSSCRGATTVP
jgi:radical SAM/Cys-rich protein